MDEGSYHCSRGNYQDHPQEREMKKDKMIEKALHIAEEWREEKGKGEKERYTHLNAKFQRIARRDKKAFIRGQCKEIMDNNRMKNTRDLFKKISPPILFLFLNIYIQIIKVM